MLKTPPQSGFIALTSVIIISILLLSLTAVLSCANYFSRYNILESEFKLRSASLAEGCVNYALTRLASEPGYATTTDNHTVVIGNGSCGVISVSQNSPAIGQTTIVTQGVYPKNPPEQSYINLKVTVNSATLSILSWQQTPN